MTLIRVSRNEAFALVRDGFVILTGYDEKPAERARSCFAEVLEVFGAESLRRFQFEHERRPDGVREPDDGFLDWTRETELKKDRKFAFHYRPDLRKKMDAVRWKSGEEAKYCLSRLLNLSAAVYNHHSEIAMAVLTAVDALELMSVCFADELKKALVAPAPTSRSVVRFLYYPESSGNEKAKVHYDRSLLTLHSGDEGGSLFAVSNGHERVISPRPGELLVFWGSKASRLATKHGAKLKALAHGARAREGEVRQAVVSFWHNNDVLWDAEPVTM
ncbi:MAG TPA: 2OG-Fe(II) oxygenase family protein [Candidatus Paceibacterota bacterium]|nr:2OG-Fe(II) oxygenase family protein [Candidatus Paceibacterota bacterium]